MTRFIKIIAIGNLLLLTAFVCYFFFDKKKKTVGYVEISKLYKEFKMTKELESKFTAVTNARKSFLDSIELQIRSMKPSEKMGQEFENMRNVYIQKKQQFEEDNLAMNQQYNSQIMNQMNQYISDFGTEENFDFIFGANGNGGIMYANEKTLDLTTEVLAYINKKYDGKIH